MGYQPVLAAYSPLSFACRSLTRYLECRATHQELLLELDRAEAALLALDTVLSQSCQSRPELELWLDAAFGCLNAVSDDEVACPQPLLVELRRLDEQFACLEVASLHAAAERQAQRHALRARLEKATAQDDVEAGNLRWLLARWDAFLHRDQLEGPLFASMRGLQARNTSRWQVYRSTRLAAHEWTVEMAFADELMEQGFAAWGQGLSELLAQRGQVVETEVLSALELLRTGNRCWLQVERLGAF